MTFTIKKFDKPAYVCGPLTELSPEEQATVKAFYSEIGDLCEEVTGIRAFVPHEYFDPIKMANFTPGDVDAAERRQVCEETSVVIVIAVAPSWGGGIEVEMAYRSAVPVIILCETEKLQQRKISRLLRGNPAVAAILDYASKEDALAQLKAKLKELYAEKP